MEIYSASFSHLALHQHVEEDIIPLGLLRTCLETTVQGGCVRRICARDEGWKGKLVLVTEGDDKKKKEKNGQYLQVSLPCGWT